MHQFKCVANAINVHEFTFNILSFIHFLLNNISIAHDLVLFYSISFLHSQIYIKSFPFHYFNSITHFQLYYIVC